MAVVITLSLDLSAGMVSSWSLALLTLSGGLPLTWLASLKDLTEFLNSTFLNSQGALYENEKISAKLKNVKGKVRLHGVAYLSFYIFEFRIEFFSKKQFETLRNIKLNRCKLNLN